MAKEQRGLCFYCHLRLDTDMTWEHLVARANGGSNRVSNLRIAHSKCNAMVGALSYDVKMLLHAIGRDYSSDAFFRLAPLLHRLEPGSLAMSGARRRRRPKRPAAAHRWTFPPYVDAVIEEVLREAA